MAGKKRSNYRKSNIISALIIAVVCAVIVAATLFYRSKIDAQNEYYSQMEVELQSQIDDENERTGEIEEYSRYVKSDEFAEEAAREKFGLVTNDEIVLKATESAGD